MDDFPLPSSVRDSIASYVQLQIADKISRELVFARAALKKALRTTTNIYGARKRLVWLENHLEHLLTEKSPKVSFVRTD